MIWLAEMATTWKEEKYEEDMEEASDVYRCCGNGNVTLLSCPALCQKIDTSFPPHPLRG
jgi:hypothetical protein